MENESNVYFTDIIGDEYKNWGTHGRVLLNGSCNTGKTEFIINLCENMKLTGNDVLYLCNRSALESDVKDRRNNTFTLTPIQQEALDLQLFSREDFLPDHPGGYPFTVKTYQWLENYLNKNKDELMSRLSSYKYIVADECHYFHCDSEFNSNTHLSKKVLEGLADSEVIIYMSATANLLFDEYLKDESHLIKYYYLNKLSNVTKLYTYSRDTERMDILNNLPEGEKALVVVNSRKDLLNMQEVYGDNAGYYCSEHNPGGAMDDLPKCLKNSVLQKNILFCTTALYNGVNIRDPALKHILIEVWDPISVQQAIGRKRPINKDDTCAVYIRCMSKPQLEHSKAIIDGTLEIPEIMKDEDKCRKFISEYGQDELIQEINSISVQEFDFKTMSPKYTINETKIDNLIRKSSILDKMLKNGYLDTLLSSISNSISSELHPIEYMPAALSKFIHEHLRETMKKKDLVKSLVEAGKITVSGRSANKSIGYGAVNKVLAPYGYKIYLAGRISVNKERAMYAYIDIIGM